MKTRLFISVFWAALLIGAVTHQSEANAYPGTADSSVDEDRSAGELAAFRLMGVALSSIPGQTLAVIEMGIDQRQRLIREGDIIGEMSVKKISIDRVLFSTGQGERIVRLHRAALESANDDTLSFRQPVSVKLPPFDNIKIVEVERETLATSLRNVNDIVQQVNINPIVVYGEPIGIRISPIDSGGIFEELGLDTGDIITAVNGQEIRNPDEAVAFLGQIQVGGEFDISVRGSRHDKEIQLTVK